MLYVPSIENRNGKKIDSLIEKGNQLQTVQNVKKLLI